MAFEPSYNILDKDTHNTLVDALKSGGIGYTEADGTVHKISDTYASGGGSSLPEVTSDDNGDVLTVVEGAWAKAAPSGGAMLVTLTYDTVADDGTYTADKSYADIHAALASGSVVVATLAESGESFTLGESTVGATHIIYGARCGIEAGGEGGIFVTEYRVYEGQTAWTVIES